MAETLRLFSVTEGGPFHRIEQRFGLTRGFLRPWCFGILLWLPVVIGECLRAWGGFAVDPIALDLSMHARFLAGVPLILAAERLLSETSRASMRNFYDGDFCERAAPDRILDRAERLRDSRVAEAIVLVLAMLGGHFTLWGIAGSAGWVGGSGGWLTRWSIPRVWYAGIALPVAQFVMLRWLWRWLIWSYVLARLSRLRLATLATHADHAAGLGHLAKPVSAFSAFSMAIGSVLAGAWSTRVLAGEATIESLFPELLAFLLGVVVVALTPLLLFSGHLFRARRKGLTQYGDFMRGYTLRFHAKWIASDVDAEHALGSPDIQSLSDLGNSYMVVAKTRLFVFGPRNLMNLWGAAILPSVPLLAHSLTVEQALKRILTTILGGLPL